MLKTSPEGVDLILGSETFVDHLYNDPSPEQNCTVGYGTLVHRGPCNGHPSEAPYINGITEPKARQIALDKITSCEKLIRTLVKVPIDQSEFDALVDFTYNLGAAALLGSTLLKKLNRGDYAGAQAEFGRWIFAHGKRLSGLAVRRAKETKLFARDLPRQDVNS